MSDLRERVALCIPGDSLQDALAVADAILALPQVAAAPDMLEALKEARALIASWHPWTGGVGSLPAIVSIDAALAKATGQPAIKET